MSIFSKLITSLNIESDSVRVLQVDGRKIVKYAEAPIPAGMISNGIIEDTGAVSSIIYGLFKEHKIRRKQILVSMGAFRSVARVLTLPKLNKKGTTEAVAWAADREMPVSLDSVYVWWSSLEKTGNEQKVFILGTPRPVLDSLQETLSEAGVHVKAIDCKPIVISRLADNDAAVVLDMENEAISTVLKYKGTPDVLKTSMINPKNSVMEDRIQKAYDDIFRTVEYFNTLHEDSQINTKTPIMLTGGLVSDELTTMIQDRTGRSVFVPELDLIEPEGFDCCRYAVNIGLLMREVNLKKKFGGKKPVFTPDIRKAKSLKV